VCHSTNAWTPASFDHSGITGNCQSCHNNTIEQGKPSDHLPTSADCNVCHSTVAWTPASFDHTGITGNCQSCHNNTIEEGKPQNHIPTTQDCNVCHSTVAWLPASFSHVGVTGNCASCHNGSTATGKDSGHFQTNLDCSDCHTTVAWQPDNFFHKSPNYPGQHQRNLGCTDCHTSNAQAIPWRFAAYQPACAGCHANDYEADEHKKSENPNRFYNVSELRDCSGACHEYTDGTFTTIRETRTGEHRVGDGDFD
jgi:hypothetical protein